MRRPRRPRGRTVRHHRCAAGQAVEPGWPPRLSDAELVCLAVAQVLLGCNSERRWLRFVGHRLRHLFPCVPGQSGYHRRLRAAAPALRLTLEHLARTASSWGGVVGGPVAAAGRHPGAVRRSRETVKRSDLAGWAGYGYERSHPRRYWGLKLYLLAAPDGMPVAWVLPPPSWASARSRPRC